MQVSDLQASHHLYNRDSKGKFWNGLLEVDLEAIAYNLATIQSHIPHAVELMPVLKSEGYGTGSALLAKFLFKKGVPCVALAFLHEAIALRKAGIHQSLFVINASNDELASFFEYDIELAVSSLKKVQTLIKMSEALEKPLQLHVNLDTGMGRFGASLSEAFAIFKELQDHKLITIKGLMTHFTSACMKEHDLLSLKQADDFSRFIQLLKENHLHIPPYLHISNSSFSLRFPHLAHQLLRVGIALFGIHTSKDSWPNLQLKGALSLRAKIIHIREAKKGDTIGYGRHYQVQKEKQRIAVLSLGYADGIHTHYSQNGYVLIRGQKAPYVGRICMDCMMVDIDHIEQAIEGDHATIFGFDDQGNYLAPETVAGWGNSIPHELITCLGPRIYRKYLKKKAI